MVTASEWESVIGRGLNRSTRLQMNGVSVATRPNRRRPQPVPGAKTNLVLPNSGAGDGARVHGRRNDWRIAHWVHDQRALPASAGREPRDPGPGLRQFLARDGGAERAREGQFMESSELK
jgi:hypothetical protein